VTRARLDQLGGRREGGVDYFRNCNRPQDVALRRVANRGEQQHLFDHVYAKTITAAAAVQPTQNTSTVLLGAANGTVGGSTMDLLCAAATVHLRQRDAQLGHLTRLCECRHGDSEGFRARRRHPPATALGDLQSAEPRQLRRAEPGGVHANVGRIFSTKPPRQMQFGVKLLF
jgi:hypothetical protein